MMVHACGHRTTHTQRIGCCAGCSRLFSSDTAFEAHRSRGRCLEPETVGLQPRPSRTAPGETVWANSSQNDAGRRWE